MKVYLSGRRAALLLLVATALALAACQGRPATDQAADATPRPSALYAIQDFLDNTSYYGASFSPDNSKLLVTSDHTGVRNAYAIPTAGGEPVPLTQSTTESIVFASYFPTDERFLFMRDEGGNELFHVFVQELDGTVRDLTPGEGLRASYAGFAYDEKSFLIRTTERNGRLFDVYEYDVGSYERTLFYQNDSGKDFAGLSPDKRYLVLAEMVSNADTDIYVYDRERDETRLLTRDEGEVQNNPSDFSPDSKSLYYTTDAGSEFTYLVRHDLESDAREVVFRADWDVRAAGLSHHGKYLLVRIDADARSQLKLFLAADMTPVELPPLPEAEFSSVALSRDEAKMAFYSSSSRMPQDLFVYDLDGTAPRQLTRSLNPKIDPQDLVDGEVVRFTSWDGREIPGILYLPHQARQEGAKLPALVWVHGGPGGQSRVGYQGLIQYLVNHGYVVFAVNNRGSSGYGKTFFHLDDRKHGTGDLDDCVASKEMLIATGKVDPERIGILGGSYGGYMTLAALTFRPEAFAVGIDLFGISNWLRTVQSIPPWWESQRASLEQEMGEFDDEEYFRGISPLFHAENIVRPLLVIQGANDPRVLQAESDDIVAAARRNGVPVEYVVFDDEGHGFRKKENQERAYEAILKFADRYLKGVEAPAAGEQSETGA